MKRVSVVLVLFVSLAGVAAAGDVMERGLCIKGRDLAKRTYVTPNLSFDLFSRGTIDVGRLIEGVNLTNGESAESIYAKVDAQRQRLYPDEEIILSITIPEPAKISAVAGSSLVKAIYWWNNANAANISWWAYYYSTVATVCVNDIQYGNYKFYQMAANGSWVYKRRMGAGYSLGGYSCGSYMLRGFKGVATVASKADIVIYFFK
jgi:hypothetical protein